MTNNHLLVYEWDVAFLLKHQFRLFAQPLLIGKSAGYNL